MTFDLQAQSLLLKLERDVELVYKFFPLEGQCNPSMPKDVVSTSCEAAAAAYLAHTQGRFWEYSNALYEHFRDYSRARLLEYANEVGVPDMDSSRQRLDDPAVMRRLSRDVEEGLAAGVGGTPTVFVNGYRLETGKLPAGQTRYGVLKATIKALTR